MSLTGFSPGMLSVYRIILCRVRICE